MEELKVEKTEVITKFKTSDREVFDRKDRAELHEQFLIFAERVDKLKHVGGAYYCETQEEFDAIVDMHAYAYPFWDFCSSTYKPDYCYSKKGYKGSDWYFFKHEYQNDAPDYYWVETLSEMKTEWEEFYSQFK